MAPRWHKCSAATRGSLKSMRRLNVALVTETFPPEINGVAMTLGRLAAGQSARGHRLRIVRPRQHGERTGLLPSGHLLTRGLPIPRYPELRFGMPCAGNLWHVWREQRPDVVHIATEGPLGFSALAAARRLNLPVISSFHTNFHSYSRHYGIGWLQSGIEVYLRWFHNRTATTLVPTTRLAEQLGQRGLRNAQVLSRGVDTQLFSPERRSRQLRSQWGVTADEPVCIVVGRLAPEKNLRLAFNAFNAIQNEHPRSHMVCVGDGPLAHTLKRAYPDTIFAGTRTGEDLATHYASADLFLFPSLTETYGNVVIEALASGLPVIAYDHAAASDLICDGSNGHLAAPGDAQAFVAAACGMANKLHDKDWSGACFGSVHHLDWERIHNCYEAALQAAIVNCQSAADSIVPAPTLGI